RLPPGPGVAGAPSARSAGTVRAAASTTNGRRPANTRRHVDDAAMNPAAAGPTIAGRTQALDMIANIRGRSVSEYARAMLAYVDAMIAPEPMPWMSRPATTTSIAGAVPAIARPSAKSDRPVAYGSSVPRRSAMPPATITDARLPRKNAL